MAIAFVRNNHQVAGSCGSKRSLYQHLTTGPVPIRFRVRPIAESPAPPHYMQPLLEQSRPSSAEPDPEIQRIIFRQPENFPGQSSLVPVYTKATTGER